MPHFRERDRMHLDKVVTHGPQGHRPLAQHLLYF